ncbi:MAG: hypothetical protein HYV09_12190 [Deltaproteobacteria bacterium]|nr:hypothetical protein [Deltaproteobacteria bacterium]
MVTRMLALSLVIASSCRREPPPVGYEPAAAPTSTASIPLSPASGRIAGKPFTVAAARYSIDRRPGYEKVEIELLAEKPDKPCGDVAMKHATSVWLRVNGVDAVRAETVRIESGKPGPWEAHYQVFDQKKWIGNGDASALIAMSAPAPDMKLSGELSACFGDGSKSCIAGRFEAIYCPIRIDALVRGSDAMERPPAGKLHASTP